MCGRFMTPEEREIERNFELGRRNWNPFRRFNTAPGMEVPVLLAGSDGLTLDRARWGFIPHWWREAKPPRHNINATVERIASSGMWRHAYRHARCLVPAAGWYEWQVVEDIDEETGEVRQRKQPTFIHRPELEVFAFAAIFAERDERTIAILTCPAAGAVAQVHHRMPVVLDGAAALQWVEPGEAPELAPARDFRLQPVSTFVNSPRNESERCIEPV